MQVISRTEREALVIELRNLDNPRTEKTDNERERDDARIAEICKALNIEFAEDAL